MDLDTEKDSLIGNVTAIITAAGKGTRMNSDINKQYIKLAGIPVLSRTIEAFQQCKAVDSIILVVNEEDINFCRHRIVEHYNFTKVKSLVSGGAQRQNSVYKGLCAVREACKIVLIHDGARPFVTNENIVACINAVKTYGACGVGVRLKDTVKICDQNGFVTATPDRNNLWSIQTPQGFAYDIIMDAHEKAIQSDYIGTDDMVLVEKLGIPVKIVEGNYQNIKITTPEDLAIGESIVAIMQD
ncbi:MAG: 2-C-methyl-D-erythritol 4-phosphate cytidylyltransferase [Ruminiclostridium sp.]